MNILRVSLACLILASQYSLASAYADPDQTDGSQSEGRAAIGEREGSAIVGNVSSGIFRHDFIPQNNVQRNDVPGFTSMKDVSYQDVPQGYVPYKQPDPQTMVVNEYIDNGAGGLQPLGPQAFQPLFRLDKGIGGGIGYDDGYSNLGILLPFTINPDQSMLFLDLRAMVTDQGAGGVNLGAGWRAYSDAVDKIFTFAGWYDYDGGHFQDYHQIGLSGEVIGQYLTGRINGYFDINSNEAVVSNNLSGNAFYQTNRIVLDRVLRSESSYGGVDAEVGGPLPVLGKFGIDAFVGGYYYNSDSDKSATGVKFRAEANINDWWQMGVSYAKDSVFGSNAWMNVTLSIPEGRSDKWMRPKTLKQRMYQPMNRNYRIVANIKETTNTELAINPDDGLPYTVQHIDPDFGGAGNGNFETPFGSVAAYNASPPSSVTDIIFVKDGNAANLDGQITLLDNGGGMGSITTGQRLLSEARQHTFNTFDQGGAPVTLNLPGYNPAASMPTLSNSAGAGGSPGAVVVGTGGAWEVSGFNISGARTGGALPHNDGIFSAATRGFNINNNTFVLYNRGIDVTNLTAGTSTGIVSTNTFSGDGANSLHGALITHNGGTLELAFHNNTATNNLGVVPPGTGTGFEIIANAGSVNGVGTATDGVTTLGITGNTANANGTGMIITANGGAVITTDKSNNTFNANINPNTGLHVNANGVGSSVIFRSFDTITATGNTGIGIAFDTTGGGLISALSEDLNQDGILDPGEDLNGNGVLDLGMTNINASTNTTDGFVATSDGAGGASRIDLNIGNANSADNLFNSNGQNGISLVTLNAGTIRGSVINNTATGNTQDGFASTLTTGTIDLSVLNPAGAASVGSNIFTGNTRHGMSIVNNTGGAFTTALISNNDFSNNTEAGLFIGGDALGGTDTAVNTLGTLDSNNFNRDTSGTEGILFNSSDVRTTAILTRNTFVGRTGAGRGVGGVVGGTTTVVGTGGVLLTFGSLSAVDNSLVNTFMNNGDAHIGLVLEGNTLNDVDIDQHDFNTTLDSTNTDFDGQGVGFILRDTAIMATSTFQRNTFQNNAASGLYFSVTGNNGADFAQLNNITVGGSTAPFGNTFTGNTGSGLEVIRTANGQVNTFDVQFNTFTGNTLDGISLTAANANLTDTYTINDNTITGNTENGIDISVQADAVLDADMARNTITGNTLSGIRTTEMINDASDQRGVSGNWVANTITGNGAGGIELDAASNVLVIGGAGADRNIIQSNTGDGVAITGAGTVTLNNNLIASNTGAGIDIDAPSDSDIIITNNDITLNTLDGIEYRNATSGTFILLATGNTIDFNDGRGFDVLARPGAATDSAIDITFSNNVVNANLLEGVYVVYTASNNQTQDVASTTALLADGGLFDDVQLRMTMDTNQILANGFSSGFGTTGLVVRVGTTNGSTSSTNAGGFASDGVGNFTNSGVIMSVTNSTITGNFGSDAFFESFTSTVDPAATAGTWGATNDPTALTTFRSDPLARLDLDWGNNTIIAGDVTNTGAFYNNADTFKSRLNTTSVPFDGPFTSTSRRRNAQRQAARINNLIDPGAGTFLYSGTGASTFRLDSTGDLLIFTLDGNPYTTTGDANGINFGGAITGELPWGWGQF
ncbi:MAG: right-handed parallel beta-helix repeat-containing protein [Planctomycetes bacterium]|nr:right-handed parallel beta-helix repeat-containing protein [Planctomycetota bacterium]MCH9723937.1 right-handed parallel beta-helix repeat-containing protein [Planctomycetota bacterium]MCH9778663.1 right-handed parallel beta-helix repeat-containing protein [Planctomycetota bacterium]MCH9791250.1 right-handed parallel beta-helix repeat-containing protein [Planctomycetota bacterium]